jgi:hypothetical protein
MSNDTSSQRPVEPVTARPVGADSLQQPVKGDPVVHPLHEETAPAAVAGPAGTAQAAPRAGATAYQETAYAEPAYRDPAYSEPQYQQPQYQEPGTREPQPAGRYQHYQEPAPRDRAPAEPAYAAPAPAPAPMTRTATVSSPGRIGFGAAVLILGVLLGVSDQQADGSGMALRIPALVAALIMVAQGIQLVLRGLPRDTEVEVVEVVDDTDPAHARTTVRPRPWAAGMAAFRSDPGSMTLPTIVIVLAIWLGLADLRITDAPETFSNLSMISAFVLFALGWTLIPARSEI